MAAHFSPAFFTFLGGLKRHNNRDWFEANRDRFVRDVEAPMQQFISDFAVHLKRISRAYVADPRRTGGSMFRLYRDTRFSDDKTPYKTWVAARFAHEARKARDGVPAFYLHLANGDCAGGGGVYHLDTPALTRIREHIVAQPKKWTAVRATGVEIEGDVLKRPPAGFDPNHRFVEDLKRKDLYALAEFTKADVIGADFLGRYVESCERAAPLVEFLTKALGLRW